MQKAIILFVNKRKSMRPAMKRVMDKGNNVVSNQRRGVVWTFRCREACTGNCAALYGIERIPIMDRLGKSVERG